MSNWNRRSVLAAGAALSVGCGLASVGAATSESDAGALPDPELDPNPEMDEDWASYRGDAGHARYIDDGHEFDGESFEAAWAVDHDGTVAIADGTVYTTTVDGAVALDAADGSLVWENSSVDASAPSVVGETVYLTGDEVVALDRSDGSVRWTSDFDPEDSISDQTVAYGQVYVVVDGALYALDADDGSVLWDNEPVTAESSDEAYEFTASTAAANGVVYAVTGDATDDYEGVTLALEPETGAEVWRAGGAGGGSQPLATTTAVALDRVSYYARTIQDAQTGEEIERAGTEYAGLTLGTEIYIGGSSHSINASSLDGSEYGWEKSIHYDIGEAVISGETVYVYFPEDSSRSAGGEVADYSRELVALDKYDGTEKWALSTDDLPVGEIRAISGATIYVDHDGDLVALRDQTADEEPGDTDGDTDNTDDTDGDADGTDEDQGDTDEAGPDCPDDGTESSCGEDDSGTDADDGGRGDSETGADGDDGDTGNGDGTGDGSTDAEDETDDGDGTPGFTTGAGLLGGALGLEWLRRRAGGDDPAE
ncbi:PQQ-binding-like beta-propeller repeat protein [Natronorubrum sp. FCH18a]|uniref:PQQ-binding-like beta-propeller repeat protein n=1 Tax=Natronorubrum sp. FCH18a TaxID=3447018 RepID=UPI003F518877